MLSSDSQNEYELSEGVRQMRQISNGGERSVGHRISVIVVGVACGGLSWLQASTVVHAAIRPLAGPTSQATLTSAVNWESLWLLLAMALIGSGCWWLSRRS